MDESVRVQIDADAFAKLAHWSLLDELPGLFGCSWSQFSTLASVKHRALRVIGGKADRLFSDTAAAQRALAAAANLGEMGRPDTQILASLQSVAQIDAGEAVLFAVPDGTRRIVTGDKRALKALAVAATPQLRERLQNNIVSLELVLLAALERLGIEEMRRRVCPYRSIDKVTIAVFGSTCQAPEHSVRAGLQSYIADIRKDCPLLTSEDLKGV